MQELGTGVLVWDGAERRSDRYGTVCLVASLSSKGKVRLVQAKEGARGHLVAIVKETRQSRHIGDLSHGVFPKTPEVGQKITLGEGTMFFEGESVGLRPDDSRSTQWLDMRALYNAHDQTVTLYFEELSN